MKRIILLGLCILLVSFSAGCQSNKTRVAEGAVIGGTVGAAAGGIIGHQSGSGGEGAGIGAAAGAAIGALIGSQIEKPGQAKGTSATSQTANPNQMSIQDVIGLSQQGIEDDVIIERIRLTNSEFNLMSEDITYLRGKGVSQKVIDAMQGRN